MNSKPLIIAFLTEYENENKWYATDDTQFGLRWALDRDELVYDFNGESIRIVIVVSDAILVSRHQALAIALRIAKGQYIRRVTDLRS